MYRRHPSGRGGGASNPFTGRSLPSPYRQNSSGQHHGNHQAATLQSIGKKAGLIFVSLVLFFYLMSGGAEEEYITPQSYNSNIDANKSRRSRGRLNGEPKNLRPSQAVTMARESRSKSNPSRDFGSDSFAASGDKNSGDFHYRKENSNDKGMGDHSQDGLEAVIGSSQDTRRGVATPPMRDLSDPSSDIGDAGTTLPAGGRSDNNSQDLRGKSRSASGNEFGRGSEASADTIDETAYRKSGEIESSDNAVTTEAAAKSVSRSSPDVGVHTYKKGLSTEDALNAESPDDNPLGQESFVKRSDPLEIPLNSHGSANTESHKTNASNDAEDSMDGRDRKNEMKGSTVKSSTAPAKSIDASEDTEDKTKLSADLFEKNSSPLEVPVAEGGDELAVKPPTVLAKAIESEDTEDKSKQSSDTFEKNSSPVEIPVAVDDSSKDQLGSADTATQTNRTVPVSEASKDSQATKLPRGREDDKTEVSSQDRPLAKESAPLEVPSKVHDDGSTESPIGSESKQVLESEDQESVSASRHNATSKNAKPLEEVEDEVTTNKDSSALGDINQTSSSDVREIEDESQSIDASKSNETNTVVKETRDEILVNRTATSKADGLSSNEENEAPVEYNSAASETHTANLNATEASEDSAGKTAEEPSGANSEDGSQPQVNTTARDDPSSIANETSASASVSVENTTATAKGDAVVEDVGNTTESENEHSQVGQDTVAESSRDDNNSTLSNAAAAENRGNSTSEAVNSTAPALDEGNSTAKTIRKGVMGKVGQMFKKKVIDEDTSQPTDEVEENNLESEAAEQVQVESDAAHGSRPGGSHEKNTEPAKSTTTKKKKKKGKHNLRGPISKKEKAVS